MNNNTYNPLISLVNNILEITCQNKCKVHVNDKRTELLKAYLL